MHELFRKIHDYSLVSWYFWSLVCTACHSFTLLAFFELIPCMYYSYMIFLLYFLTTMPTGRGPLCLMEFGKFFHHYIFTFFCGADLSMRFSFIHVHKKSKLLCFVLESRKWTKCAIPFRWLQHWPFKPKWKSYSTLSVYPFLIPLIFFNSLLINLGRTETGKELV